MVRDVWCEDWIDSLKTEAITLNYVCSCVWDLEC